MRGCGTKERKRERSDQVRNANVSFHFCLLSVGRGWREKEERNLKPRRTGLDERSWRWKDLPGENSVVGEEKI